MAIDDDMTLVQLADRVGHALLQRDETIATAESCTGGWIAKVLTDIPGSSSWFHGGWVTYSNSAKNHLLGVDAATLQNEGAVSQAVVKQMAENARAQMASTYAVAVSGIAGPDGGTPDKPVGTVWCALAASGQPVWTRLLQLEGDRETIRRETVRQVLERVLDQANQIGAS